MTASFSQQSPSVRADVPVLIKPVSACNLGCSYCYQESSRMATAPEDALKLNSLLDRMDQLHALGWGEQVLHGGEILLLPLEKLEILLSKLFEQNGETAMQTNGLLVTEAHVSLFKKYNTRISLSLDGPAEMNALRHSPNLDNASQIYSKIIKNLSMLREAGIGVAVISVISTLHSAQGAAEKFCDWISKLADFGITSGRCNLLYAASGVAKGLYEMSNKEAIKFFEVVAPFVESRPDLYWNPFEEIKQNILNPLIIDNCVYADCDPFRTDGVVELNEQGEIGNCSRLANSNSKGHHAVCSVSPSLRSRILKKTDYSEGGCQGCDYWDICKGHCPAEAIDNNWMKRSRFCETWHFLYTYYEGRLDKGRGFLSGSN